MISNISNKTNTAGWVPTLSRKLSLDTGTHAAVLDLLVLLVANSFGTGVFISVSG